MIKHSLVCGTLCLVLNEFEKLLILFILAGLAVELWRVYLHVKNKQNNTASMNDKEQHNENSPTQYKFDEISEVNQPEKVSENKVVYKTKRMSPFYKRCQELIDQHIGDEHYNAKMLAEDLHIDRTYLYKKLKHYTTITPAKLIEQAKVEYAVSLLKDASLSKEYIAIECGFKNVGAMSEAFMKYLHHNPDYYRTADIDDDTISEKENQQ